MRKIRKKTECQHKWTPLLGRIGKKNVPTALFTCLKCGELKVGTNTIRISKNRLDMGGLPLYAGNIELGENAGLRLDALLSADGKYSGIIESGTAGATLAFGDLCYLDPTDSKWELADANVITSADGDPRGLLGLCILAANADGATKMLLWGKIRAATFPAFTINEVLYVSETPGDITHTQPTTADVAIRVVGVALTAEDMFFNPSPDYITHI